MITERQMTDILADVMDETAGQLEVLAIVADAYAAGMPEAGVPDWSRFARELRQVQAFLVDEGLKRAHVLLGSTT